MEYKVGGQITSKNNHACGSDKWVVARTGADVKLKCLQCGHSLFLSQDQVKKMTKSYVYTENTDSNV